ncbi:MAG: type II toxin-antitoxin system Phd/YefM family antitoxin [Acidobacteriales bacterium]|nr:type II toxin-antitoxin system Phd/YefM family antitoxin [Terriglobales bacterium]
MKKVAAAQFKAHCLTLMDQVQEKREPILITKRGKPIAKIVPVDTGDDKFLGRLRGVLRITGDIESPVDSPEAWDVER